MNEPTRDTRSRKLGLSLVASCLAATACFTTTVRSGKPPAPATVEHDGKWHHGLVYGLAELSGPYDLQEMCPNGWAEITTETSFVNGIAQSFTSNIYSPQSVTVRCAVDDEPTPAPAAGAPNGATDPEQGGDVEPVEQDEAQP